MARRPADVDKGARYLLDALPDIYLRPIEYASRLEVCVRDDNDEEYCEGYFCRGTVSVRTHGSKLLLLRILCGPYQLVRIAGANDITRLCAVGRPDDAPVFKHVDEFRGARVADAELTLQV